MESFIVPGLIIEGNEMSVPNGTSSERPDYREGLFWGNKDLGVGQLALGGRWINLGGLSLAEEIISSKSLTVGNRYPVNSNGGEIVITLPDDAEAGAQLALFDSGDSWDTNTVTLVTNGKINNSTADYELTTANGGAQLIFLGGGKGWFLIGSTGGGSGGSGTGTVPPTFVEGVFNADHDKSYFVNLENGDAICTLPDFKVGKIVSLNDHFGLCSELNTILITASSPLHGKFEDIVLDRKNVSVTLQAVDEVQGWKIISGVGLELVEVTGEGLDHNYRATCVDVFGHHSFLSGLEVTKITGTDDYKIKSGMAYIGGLRAYLQSDKVVTITDFPNNIYLEVYRDGTALSTWDNIATINVTGVELNDYVNAQGITSYVAKVASLTAVGGIVDERDVFEGALERSSNKATDDDIVNRSTADKHINLPQFWAALEKEITDVTEGTSNAYLTKTGTAADSSKLAGVNGTSYARTDVDNVMIGNFLWKNGQDFKGMYWGDFVIDDDGGHAGSYAYVRQAQKDGDLEIGADGRLDYYDTDTRGLVATLNFKEKVFNIDGDLQENGLKLSLKYLSKTATAADSVKLNGQAASYYAAASNVLTPVPENAVFTDTFRPITDSVTFEASDIGASAKAVATVYREATRTPESDVRGTSPNLKASILAVNTVYQEVISLLNKISDSVTTINSGGIASSTAVKIAYDKANRAVSSSYTDTSTTTLASSKAVQSVYEIVKGMLDSKSSSHTSATTNIATSAAVKACYDACFRIVSNSVVSSSSVSVASSWAVKQAYDKAVSATVTKSNSVTSTSTTDVATSYAVKLAYDKAAAASVTKSNSVTSTSTSTVATSYAVRLAYAKTPVTSLHTLFSTTGSTGLGNGTIVLTEPMTNYKFVLVIGTNDDNNYHVYSFFPTNYLKSYTYSDTYKYRQCLFADHSSYWIIKTNDFQNLYQYAENSRIRRIVGINLT